MCAASIDSIPIELFHSLIDGHAVGLDLDVAVGFVVLEVANKEFFFEFGHDAFVVGVLEGLFESGADKVVVET